MNPRGLGTEGEEHQGSPGLQEEEGAGGRRLQLPLGDSREIQEQRTHQAVGPGQYIEGPFPTGMSLGSWENPAWEQPHPLRNILEEEMATNSSRPRAEQGQSRDREV